MIICRYIGGSSRFVSNPRDIDEIIVLDDWKSINELTVNTNDENVDRIFTVVERMSTDFYGLMSYYFAQLLREHRVSVLEGTFPLEANDKILCELAMNEHCFNNCVCHRNGGASKTLYAVLLALFYFRKGNCELTDEEQEQIQLAHDGYFPKEKLPAIQKELREIYARL